jgi:macrodomain Ter protein organizer (MatP/YcbG family)
VKLLATADNVVCEGFEGRSISLPVKVWRLLERLKNDRQDPTLSDTIRVLLLDHLAENSYLEDREKKALRITV